MNFCFGFPRFLSEGEHIVAAAWRRKANDRGTCGLAAAIPGGTNDEYRLEHIVFSGALGKAAIVHERFEFRGIVQ